MKVINLKSTVRSILNIFILSLLLTSTACTDNPADDYEFSYDVNKPDGDKDDDKDEVKDPLEKPEFNGLCDSEATAETIYLFENLRKSAEKGVIIGQQEAYLENSDKKYQANCAISDVTGEFPLLAAGDLENLTNDDYVENESNWRYKRVKNSIEWVKECHKKGVFMTFCWHFREPYYGKSFYVDDMDKANAGTSAKAFKSILEGGENHDYYKKKLDRVANYFKSLKDENGALIPVIFRPFHEYGGKWFWWGVPYYASPAEFIQNWQFTVDYLRDECDVHNVIYAITPGFSTEAEYLKCYPGDEYVDILGMDSYTNNKVGNASEREKEFNGLVNQLNIISNLADKRNKVAALTEAGHAINDTSKTIKNVYTEFYLKILEKMDAKIAYMQFWYNGSDKQFTPLIGDTEYIGDFQTFIKSTKILTSSDIKSPLSPDFE